jgi:hypothetical protein
MLMGYCTQLTGEARAPVPRAPSAGRLNQQKFPRHAAQIRRSETIIAKSTFFSHTSYVTSLLVVVSIPLLSFVIRLLFYTPDWSTATYLAKIRRAGVSTVRYLSNHHSTTALGTAPTHVPSAPPATNPHAACHPPAHPRTPRKRPLIVPLTIRQPVTETWAASVRYLVTLPVSLTCLLSCLQSAYSQNAASHASRCDPPRDPAFWKSHCACIHPYLKMNHLH